jgi:hypothetical protein
MNKIIFKKTEDEWLRKFGADYSDKELSELHKDKFGFKRSPTSIGRRRDRLNIKKSEECIKRIKVSSLKEKEVKKGMKMNQNEYEAFILDTAKEVTKSVVAELPKLERLKFRPRKKVHHGLKKESWILQFSDLHWGLKFRGVEVGGLSEYNTQIATQRLERLSETTSRILDYSVMQPQELVIVFEGDLVENTIMRGNQYAQVEQNVVRQVITVAEMVSDFVVYLTQYFKRIRCYGVVGNHGRITRSPTDSAREDNFDILVYEFIKQRLAKLEGITFNYTAAQHMIVRIADWNFWVEHGDSVRSWAGIPFYGAQREMANIQFMMSLLKGQVDYVLLAHHHDPAEFRRIYINGSFPGGDTYSIGSLRRLSLPAQNLLGVTKKHGVVWKRELALEEGVCNFKPKVYDGGEKE